nr:hypothetical protein Iba_chr08bCG4270 [Ipomoea batatas]
MKKKKKQRRHSRRRPPPPTQPRFSNVFTVELLIHFLYFRCTEGPQQSSRFLFRRSAVSTLQQQIQRLGKNFLSSTTFFSFPVSLLNNCELMMNNNDELCAKQHRLLIRSFLPVLASVSSRCRPSSFAAVNGLELMGEAFPPRSLVSAGNSPDRAPGGHTVIWIEVPTKASLIDGQVKKSPWNCHAHEFNWDPLPF